MILTFPARTGIAVTPGARRTLSQRPPQARPCPRSPPSTPGCGRPRRPGARGSHPSRAQLCTPRRPRAPLTSQTHKQVSGHTQARCQPSVNGSQILSGIKRQFFQLTLICRTARRGRQKGRGQPTPAANWSSSRRNSILTDISADQGGKKFSFLSRYKDNISLRIKISFCSKFNN